MKENKNLKWLLILQSFFLLFLLLVVKYINKDVFVLTGKFFSQLFQGENGLLSRTFNHPEFLRVLLIYGSLLGMLAGILVYFTFKRIQTSGYADEGELIEITEDTSETSITYFTSYIIPMVMDSISALRGFFIFMVIMVMLILLMRNTNLYYQNPILSILGYRTFRFQFVDTSSEQLKKMKCIAITRGAFDEKKVIKRKRITDNVFVIYNKN